MSLCVYDDGGGGGRGVDAYDVCWRSQELKGLNFVRESLWCAPEKFGAKRVKSVKYERKQVNDLDIKEDNYLVTCYTQAPYQVIFLCVKFLHLSCLLKNVF